MKKNGLKKYINIPIAVVSLVISAFFVALILFLSIMKPIDVNPYIKVDCSKETFSVNEKALAEYIVKTVASKEKRDVSKQSTSFYGAGLKDVDSYAKSITVKFKDTDDDGKIDEYEIKDSSFHAITLRIRLVNNVHKIK